MNSISRRIKHYRKKKRMTQAEVAAALGIRTDNYTKYEYGVRIPRDDRLTMKCQMGKEGRASLTQ